MKKILLISLITVLAIGLVGCKDDEVIDVNNSSDVVISGDNQINNDNLENEDNNIENNESGNIETESGELNNNSGESTENKEESENTSVDNSKDDENSEDNKKPEENKPVENKPVENPNDNKVPENENSNQVENNNQNPETDNNTENQEPENEKVENDNSGENNGTDNIEDNIVSGEEDFENEEPIVVSELESKLNTLVEKSGVMVRMPMASEIFAETAFTFVGLNEEEFNKSVKNAIAYESMVMPANFSLCLIELKDGSDVASIKKQVIDNCDPNKWICMSADKCLVVDSGNYIMLVMSTAEDCNSLQKAFEAQFGNAGEALTK